MSDNYHPDSLKPRDCIHGQLARSCEICDLTAQLSAVTAERDSLQTLVSEGNLRAESLRAEILRIEAERDEWVDNYADAFTGDCRHLAELSELRARVERVKALHKELWNNGNPCCDECYSGGWPCPTSAILNTGLEGDGEVKCSCGGHGLAHFKSDVHEPLSGLEGDTDE